MRKIIVIALGVSLIAASTVQIAAAATHHQGGKADRAPTSQPFRDANGSLIRPAELGWSSNNIQGHISAPAGR